MEKTTMSAKPIRKPISGTAGPSRAEVEQYKGLSDEALAKFRIFCAAGRFPKPDGANDTKPRRGSLAADDAQTGTIDDITEALTSLRATAAAFMPPDAFENVRTVVENIVGRIRALQDECNALRNKATLGDIDQQRVGALGQDSVSKNTSRISHDGSAFYDNGVFDRLRRNMSRIGVIG
jgi:hypothetical protein